jgi:CRP/FNR family cyclic AMP-dependent transcriptional regulator
MGMGSLIIVDQGPEGIHRAQVGATRMWQNNGFTYKRQEEIYTREINFCPDFAGVVNLCDEYRRNETIFAQGNPSTSVLCIQEGVVKLSVVSRTGKEAVVSILGVGAFFGEGCLMGQKERNMMAVAITPCRVISIEKQEMIRLMHAGHPVIDRFLRHMLLRNSRLEQDLADQICNSSEKRLARVLLMLGSHDKQDRSDKMVPRISQETLAEIVGTTRSRINLFMNKFRKLGFVKYNRSGVYLQINRSLLSLLLQD